MRKGFTLLELVIVMIIIGILATLGIQQFTRAVERQRGVEARQILGQIRESAAGHRLEYGTLQATATRAAFADVDAGIGAALDKIPGPAAANCRSTHYFTYAVTGATNADDIVLTATRCGAAGKRPAPDAATIGDTLILNVHLAANDDWTGTGGY